MKSKPKPVTVGSVWESKNCGKFEVVEYRTATDIYIIFSATGYKRSATAAHIRSGNVRDPYSVTVRGVGFIGEGQYMANSRSHHEPAHTAWRSMMCRCYSDDYHKAKPTYKDCKVSSEWHNFQNFAKWYYDNIPDNGEGYQLDKDLKVHGNKTYSPNTCLFLPSNINSFLCFSTKTSKSSLIGSSFSNGKGRFASYCNNPFTGKCDHLGYFDNDIDAHLVWRKKKYEHAINLANQQEREEVKTALLNWAQALKEFRIHPIDN